MSEQIVLIEISAYDKVAAQAITLRFCDGLAYRLRPTETPANALYRPFVVDAGWCRVDVFSAPGQFGSFTPGEVVLNDSSGALGQQLVNYAFDGRSLAIRIGKRGAAYPAGFVTVLVGTMAGQPTFDWDRITFRPTDLAASLRKPLAVPRFAGNNLLPAGIEGVDDIKGSVKPLVLALASNMSPILVNSAKVIYQVSAPSGSKAVNVSAVRDKGVPLTAAAAFINLAELLDDAKAPASGSYKVLSTVADGCYVRLGAKPAGVVLADAFYGTAADRSHGQVWKRLLEYAGVSGAAISAADVAAMDAITPGEIECAFFGEADVEAAAREVATSAGAAWYGDAVGVHRLTPWGAPSGNPVATLTKLRTESMDIGDVIGNGDIAPAYRVVVEYGRNWTRLQDSSLGGDKTSAADTVRAPGGRAGLAARTWLSEEYRTVQVENLATKTPHPNAIELRMTSMLASEAAAQAFTAVQLNLYGVPRHMATLTQWLSDDQINLVRPAAVVKVMQDRWGYTNGRLMRVAGVQVDRQTGKTQITCWG